LLITVGVFAKHRKTSGKSEAGVQRIRTDITISTELGWLSEKTRQILNILFFIETTIFGGNIVRPHIHSQ
jgi:hypothetical protein